MRKSRILFASAMVMTCLGTAYLQSCSKIASLVQYDLTLQTASTEIVLPPSSDTVGAATGSQEVHYNVDSFIKANTANVLGIANITSAKLTSCKLTLLNPTTANNFANFRSASGSFYSNTNTTPYSLSLSNPDTYGTVLDMPVDPNVELKGYLNGTNFTYTVGGSLRRATTDSIRVKIDVQYSVHVQG